MTGRRVFLAVFLTFSVSQIATTAELRVIRSVAIDRQAFHPFAGEVVSVTVTLAEAGSLGVLVIDRDGYPVRSLSRAHYAIAGRNEFQWDGRHDDGRLAADEAYSFRVAWTNGKRKELYFPADRAAAMMELRPLYYSRQTGTLVYELPKASRVHVQAGTSAKNPKTNKLEGPVLKTIVNREPRSAGRIAEHWNGLDESGEIHVPDLPNCVVAIAATPLPENSVIASGNRSTSFIAWAAMRPGKSLFTYKVESHAHHAGLSALDDVSPQMRLEPLNAHWSAGERVWLISDPR